MSVEVVGREAEGRVTLSGRAAAVVKEVGTTPVDVSAAAVAVVLVTPLASSASAASLTIFAVVGLEGGLEQLLEVGVYLDLKLGNQHKCTLVHDVGEEGLPGGRGERGRAVHPLDPGDELGVVEVGGQRFLGRELR